MIDPDYSDRFSIKESFKRMKEILDQEEMSEEEEQSPSISDWSASVNPDLDVTFVDTRPCFLWDQCPSGRIACFGAAFPSEEERKTRYNNGI